MNLHAQSDNFNLGNDDDWTQYDPVGDGAGVAQAVFSFPNDNSYRIQTPVIPDPAFVLGRAGSLREDVVYMDFYTTVDMVDWKDDTHQGFGILARVTTPGLQTTAGYAFSYERGSAVSATSGDMDILKITEEAGVDIGSSESNIHLDPAKDYRFVFIGKGNQLEGRVYELPNVRDPLKVVTAIDDGYPSGIGGLLTFDASGGAGVTDATFDNYSAQESEPPPLFFEFNAFRELIVTWQVAVGPFRLQSSDVLPATMWMDVSTDFIFTEGDLKLYTEGTEGIGPGQKIFRLIKD